MKKLIFTLVGLFTLFGCKTTQDLPQEEQPILASIDLVDVQEDKVMVTIDPDRFETAQTVFYIPKTVPGTYSTANYGQFAEDITAFDYQGNELEIVQIDENSWSVPNAQNLDKITYWVNDTFDIPGEGDIYSMAGTNILEDKNFLLNLYGFVGYFEGMTEEAYRLEIKRPAELYPGSALETVQTISSGPSITTDIYELERYFEVTDNPIMYAEPDTATFDIEGMKVLLHVYSPTDKFSAESFKPAMQRMISAQKDFLGDIDDTDIYAILLYLAASPGEGDAGNFGALEHHTSTVVVMPETMSQEALNKSLTDIVSHEFFHIVTPLSIHSNEIHYFDYNDPEMSQHLWMYEGTTEYFANLFQVNQDLITNQEFYDRITEKINTAKRFDDTMPFTVMSENILEDEYQNSYYNVYLKGALINMALDIRLRELSDGQMGLLDLMKALSEKYGKDRPFEDDELIPTIVDLTFPEIQEFFDQYVSGSTPIPYDQFFEKVGLEMKEAEIEVGYFLKDQSSPYITVSPTGNIVIRGNMELNSFLVDLGVEPGDVIKGINEKTYNAQNVYDLITNSMEWNEGDPIKMTVVRDGEEVVLESTITTPTATGLKLVEDLSASGEEVELRYAWLKS